jgi:hypothetical protein
MVAGSCAARRACWYQSNGLDDVAAQQLLQPTSGRTLAGQEANHRSEVTP